jgi:hypothetical protein
VMKSRNWASAPVAIERRYWNSMTHLAVARFSTTAGIVGGGCERTHATNRLATPRKRDAIVNARTRTDIHSQRHAMCSTGSCVQPRGAALETKTRTPRRECVR